MSNSLASDHDRQAARAVLTVAVLGSSMVFIDGSAVTVMLPVLQRDYDTDLTNLQWVIEAYMLFLSALMLVGGALGDRFGHKRMFIVGTGAFAAASVGCGLSPDMATLTAARAVQGIAAAIVVPCSVALIGEGFAPEQRLKAFGTWSALSAIFTAGGPMVGGWLSEAVTWRAVFLVNLPIAIAVIAMATMRLPSTPAREKRRLDLGGAALATLALGLVTGGLLEAGRGADVAPWQPALVVVGIIFAFLFVRHERRAKNPMLPPALFGARRFVGANLATFFFYAALAAPMFFLPYMLVNLRGYSAMAAGAAVVPLALSIAGVARLSTRVAPRTDPRVPMLTGCALATGGCLLFARATLGGSYLSGILPATLTLGCGAGLLIAPLTTTVINAVPSDRAGIASGINNAVARVGNLTAVALLGLAAIMTFDAGLTTALESSEFPEAARHAMIGQSARLAGVVVPEGLPPTAARAAQATIDAALGAALHAVFLFAAGAALTAGIVIALTIRQTPERPCAPRRSAERPSTFVKR